MRLLRPLILLLVSGLVAAGCGLGTGPAVSTQDEVVDALLALGNGAEGRVTADLTYDADELGDVLREDAEARALLEERLGTSDVDRLLDELAALDARLDDHAALVATGADGSSRIAASHRGRVWLDLRRGGAADGDPDAASPAGTTIDLQARIDWTVVAELLARPDLDEDLDALAATVAPLLGGGAAAGAVGDVLVGLLGGELVAISGPLAPGLLDGLRALLGGAVGDLGSLQRIELAHDELLRAAVTVDGFRTDGDDTLVDVHLELRATGTLLLDQLAAAPDADQALLDRARTALDELPERLEDVAVVRLGPDGVVRQVQADVLDVADRLAPTDDGDRHSAARILAGLDGTGITVTLDVTSVGATPTVLGDPTATATPEEVAAAISAVLLRGLGTGLLSGDGGLQDLLEGAGSG